jgi:heme exporter protein D
MILQLLVQAIALLPLLVLVAIVVWRRRQLDSDDRRDPITTDLRNLPGHGLQEQFEKFYESRIDKLVVVLSAGLMVALVIATRRIATESKPWDWLDTALLIAAIGLALHFGRQIAREMPRQRRIKQAIRAEHATAQELAASLAGNNRIIHDVQAKDFNIDHVVITPAGIFAVETKSRLKPPVGNGASAVKVKYDGRRLEFPGWTETSPLEQAGRQARWLANYLREATGERVPVFAVLALPGWFIENTARITDDMVRVINPKKSQWLLLPEKRPALLDTAAIQRAAFAIEKLAQENEAKTA